MSSGGAPESHSDEPIHVPAAERASGLGYGRSERRRRASLAPLIFLIVGALMVAAFAYFRGSDELSSTIQQSASVSEAGNQVESVVTIVNNGSTEATILSVGANAGGAIISEDVVMGLAGDSTSYGPLAELAIPAGRTAVINHNFVFECSVDGEFFIDVVVRVQVRQKGLFRVFDEPDDNADGPRYECVGGVAVEAGSVP